MNLKNPDAGINLGPGAGKGGEMSSSARQRKDLDRFGQLTPRSIFCSIIEELQKRNYSITVTARDCFQVRELADLFQLKHKLIGRHSGKSKIHKVAGLCLRALQLIPTVLKESRTWPSPIVHAPNSLRPLVYAFHLCKWVIMSSQRVGFHPSDMAHVPRGNSELGATIRFQSNLEISRHQGRCLCQSILCQSLALDCNSGSGSRTWW